MKLQFDSTQQYQLDAISAIVDLFEGQPLAKGVYEISFALEGASLALTEKGIANQLLLNDDQLLENVRRVQSRNGIHPSGNLERGTYTQAAETGEPDSIPYNFTVEMETGTGKTYTYLRTVYELNRVYGFKKFIVVVPSVAIREGVMTNLRLTHEHFQGLYGNPPLNFVMYDSKNLTALRNFAGSGAIQILVINIDSFTKDTNIINTLRETGVKPIEYLQAAHPIVILDEPQNLETPIRRAAIHNLNPLCTLRYSATHRDLYNLVYSLNPVQAYDLGLVKQIEVDGITADADYNAAFVRLKKIQAGKKSIKAQATIYVNGKGGVKPKDVTLNIGDDLYEVSGHREMYKQGYILNSINAAAGTVQFSGGAELAIGTSQGGLTEEVMRYEIDQTVKKHFEKVKSLQHHSIKVLSLFFIDRVASYRTYDEQGNAQKGRFAEWFEESFSRYARQFPALIPYSVDSVHNGYFSSDKRGTGKDKQEIWIDSKEKNTRADEDAYNLIMQDKERLLSLDEPLQFIFSHSALREGWDNPNVFQICTLNESQSEMRKRQEIGRGLRLPVNSAGERVQDKRINVLTVVANESYEEFSSALQKEIQEETGVEFSGRIKNARAKVKVKLTKELTPENFPLFFEIWDRIKQKTRYRVNFSSAELVKRTVEELQDTTKVPTTRAPMLHSQTARLAFSEHGIEGHLKEASYSPTETTRYPLPDVYAYIQSRVNITRSTIFEILKQSGRIGELEINPQMFLDNVVAALRRNLNSLLIDGIKYEQINDAYYEMRLFQDQELETYLSEVFPVEDTAKTPYNYVLVESDTEREFARDCEIDPNIKFFFKLPRGFKIPTPVGDYIPDWAVVFKDEPERVYFVAETKSTRDWLTLRGIERMKIDFGRQHFLLLEPRDVKYVNPTTTKDLYS
ncbi:MAG: DEAD/DEAH box helicase family protein [Anaerolineae bacterium]|nr:DEAD/DEAH box helicase family protein [Anaerolineae bacterium]